MYALNLLTAILSVSVICICFLIVFNKKTSKYKKNTPSYTILFVTNNEDCIEGVLRQLIYKLNTYKNYNEKIIVVSLNSTDQTLYILKKLSQKYNFIYLPQKTKL